MCKKSKERIDPMTIDERFILNFKFSSFQREVIKLIYEMRVLSTSQIAVIRGITAEYVRKQLAVLYMNGFVYKRLEQQNIGEGRKETFWMLDRGGALFIAGSYGMSVKRLNWDIRSNLINFENLSHSLKISEVRTSLEAAARSKGHKIESCFCDRHLNYEFKNNDVKYSLKPDLYFIYNDGQKKYQYFFEIDMGTMAINGPQSRSSVFTSKIPRYETFRRVNEWKNYFDVYPRVIFLTNTKSRALYMAQSVREVKETNLEFLVSTFDFFNENPLGYIYKRVSDDSVTNMFE